MLFNITKVSRNMVMLDQLIVSGVNFLQGLLLVNMLGLNDYGVFALLIMIALLVNSINNMATIHPYYSNVINDISRTDYANFLFSFQVAFAFLAQ